MGSPHLALALALVACAPPPAPSAPELVDEVFADRPDFTTTGGSAPVLPIAQVVQRNTPALPIDASLVTWPELVEVPAAASFDATTWPGGVSTDVTFVPEAPLDAGWYAVRIATPPRPLGSRVGLDDGSALVRFGVDVDAQPTSIDASLSWGGTNFVVSFSEELAPHARWTGDVSLSCGDGAGCRRCTTCAEGAARFGCWSISGPRECVVTVTPGVPTALGREVRPGAYSFTLWGGPESRGYAAVRFEPVLD